ncbi:hypothetical protein RB594_005184 [Gaeumannomyces avenae]
MTTYGYGPPPPAPPSALPSGPSSGYTQYGQYQQQPPPPAGHSHGGHSGRGGRGGHSGRGDFHGSPMPYPYGNPPPPSYAAPPHGAPPPHAPLSAHNYHPNYAPQIYQQPQYSHQSPYGPPPQQQPQQQQQTQQQAQPQPPSQAQPQAQQQPYTPHYPPYPHQQSGPPHQPWGGPGPTGHQPAGPQFGGGRGRGGSHGDRGGHKATAAMGPPIRLGFDNRQEQPAPVSNGYPAPYGPPQVAAPYPAPPYQGYPPPGPPHMPGPVHYDASYYGGQHGARAHGRGGFHSSNGRGRPHMGGDKMRHNHHIKKPGGAPSTPHNNHQKPDAASAGKKKKRKTNTLGLTPGEESDDDANEEEKLVELIGPDAPNPTDVAAWIAERKARFPTQARVKAKAAASATAGGDKPKDGGKSAAVLSLEKQKLKAEKLRKQLEKVESSIKRKREQQDEGDDMRDVTGSPSASDDSKSDTEKPDVLPSRPDPAAFVPPPSKKADPSKHCKYYSTGGICGKKGKCRFVHDDAVRQAALKEREMNGGRMTLQQRLTLNDKDQEDLTIVKTLQYLKEKGLMSGHPKQHSTTTTQPSKTEETSLSPPLAKATPENSLPARQPQVQPDDSGRYQGWDLSGFGNTGLSKDES